MKLSAHSILMLLAVLSVACEQDDVVLTPPDCAAVQAQYPGSAEDSCAAIWNLIHHFPVPRALPPLVIDQEDLMAARLQWGDSTLIFVAESLPDLYRADNGWFNCCAECYGFRKQSGGFTGWSYLFGDMCSKRPVHPGAKLNLYFYARSRDTVEDLVKIEYVRRNGTLAGVRYRSDSLLQPIEYVDLTVPDWPNHRAGRFRATLRNIADSADIITIEEAYYNMVCGTTICD